MSDEQNPQNPSASAPKFDASAAHQQKPKIRKLRAVPVPMQNQEGEQQMMLGIADAQQISGKMVVTHPAFQQVIPMLDGSRTIDEIVTQVGHGLERPMLEQLVAQLDDAGLIQGPTFEAIREKMRSDFDKSDTLPPGSTAQFADMLVQQEHGEGTTKAQMESEGAEKLREFMETRFGEALKSVENPAYDTLPKAIVAPHIDYARGWMNYANIYGRLRVADRPDRVIVLGTNHFGQSTGVCGCDKGYESPLGVCKADGELIDKLKAKLGDEGSAKLFKDRYDHENEHSVELHLPWIQHVFGADESGDFPKVFGALIHDPLVNNGESYDGEGLGIDAFVEALKGAISELPGRTLIVSSADLSHVGPAFGDQQVLAGDSEEAKAFRNQVVQHDQETLKAFSEKRIEDMIGSMSWQQNPTRWCSVGNMTAAVRIAEPERIELLNYAAAMDPQGTAFVSSAAIAMF
jgi:hypothetical protein